MMVRTCSIPFRGRIARSPGARLDQPKIPMSSSLRGHAPRLRAVVALCAFGALCWLALRGDPFEVLYHWTRVHESKQVDELIVLGLALAAAGTVRAQLRRRDAQKRLRLEESRYRVVAEAATDAILGVDERGEISYANPATERIFGLAPDRLVGSPLSVLIPDRFRERHQAAFVRYLESGERSLAWESVPLVALHRDGHEIPVEISFGASHGPLGVSFTAVIRDVSERDRARQLLRENEERLRRLYDDTPAMLFTVAPDGTVVEANAFGADLLGYAPRELAGVSVLQVLHPEDHEAAMALLAECMAHPERHHGWELRKVRRDGSVLHVRETVRATTLSDGRPAALIACEDVTTLHLAHQALQESERRLQAVTENLPGMVYQFLMRPDGTYSFPYVSDGARRTYGLEPAEIMRDADIIIANIHPDDRPAFVETVAASAERMEPWRWEGRVMHPEGEIRWLQGASRPERQPDGCIIWHGMLMDVTDFKEVAAALRASQEQLLHAQKMEAVGRLAGGVAHDFNNMLTAIKGYAQLLLLEVPEESPLRGDIEEIDRAADRSSTVTRQLLAFSRRQVLQPRVMDVNDCVRAMEAMLRRLIGEDIEVATALDPRLEAVRADPAQVEQVILNLGVNARDAMPSGGRLRIETRNVAVTGREVVRLGLPAAGRYVVMTVTDTGVGMDPEILSHIFEPFFTTKEQGKGTGLGLSTVYGIVQQSGGHVRVESAPGEGSSFSVYLPSTSARVDDGAVDGGTRAAPRGSETVLLVEDDATVRQLTARVLSMNGYSVLQAVDPNQAVRLWERHRDEIDLLLTDLVMPGKSGCELAALVRESAPSLPVLYMSGYSADLFDSPAMQVDAELLRKPFSPQLLARRVREILDADAHRGRGRARPWRRASEPGGVPQVPVRGGAR